MFDLELAKRFIERRIDAKTTSGSGPLHQARQAGTIISVVVIGVVSLVGVLIFAEINAAIPDPTNTQLNSSQTSIVDGFASALDLVPIVLLVSVAALVIGVVQRLRSGGGGMR
jgi:hypothetical protein